MRLVSTAELVTNNYHSAQTKSSSGVNRFQSNLFAVRGQQIEAACRDSEADCHASKLQVALPQDGRQTARCGLQGEVRGSSGIKKEVRRQKIKVCFIAH